MKDENGKLKVENPSQSFGEYREKSTDFHRLARIICFRYESFVMNTTKIHK